MAIADRINEMYTHVGDVYDTLEVGGAQIYILPNEFTQVDYLESSGTQYVDTGFKPNQDTRVVIDFIANQRSDAWLLGSRISYGDSNYSVLLWNGGDLRTDYNVGGQDMGASINTRYILDKNKNVSTLYQNGTQVSQITATYSEFNPNHNMYLFACNNNGSLSAIANVKMFSCKIYDNGQLIRDFIPCYRNSDNVIGLYDIVEGNFYTNKRTGVFTYGSVSREHIDKNIININAQLKDRLIDYMNNGTEKIWNNWEKVTGSGTELSLSPTIEAPMKNVLNGNTYQFTTTGKNVWDLGSLSGTTQAGVTLKQDIDGGFLLNGTSTGVGRFKIALNTDINEAITLYLKSPNNSGDVMISLRNTDDIQAISMRNDNTLKVYSYTPTAPIRYIELIQLTSGVQYTNYKIYPMIVKGSYTSSTIGDYEPYTNGASPNPDYPQDIHVVSGDNSIDVCGKNILKLPDNIRTFNGGVNVETSNNTKFTFTGTASAAYYNSFALNYHLPKGTYTMSSTNNNFKYYFWFRDKSNVTTYANVHLNNSSRTFILEEDAETIIVGVEGLTSGTTYNIETYFQLEKGDSATSYEPFNSDTYNVSLPIKNLFDSSLFTNRTVQGITLTKNSDGTITLNGTSTARADFTIIDSFSLKGDNKIASIFKKGGTTTGNVTFGIYDSNWANGKQCNITSSSDIGNASLPSEITLTKCFIRIESGITLSNLTIALQIEQGTKTNSYTPYGTTPIELCKIGDYQDRFFETSGKNLFDASTFSTFTSNVQYVLVSLKPNTEYTMTTNLPEWTGVGANLFIMKTGEDASSSTNGVRPNQSRTLTTDSTGIVKIGYRDGDNTLSDEKTKYWYMLNEGTQALPYEPYGTGWYLEKKIGKVVLDGSESWTKSSNTNVNRYYIPGTFINTILNVNTIDLISDYFTCITPTQSDAYNVGLAKLNNTSIMVNFDLSNISFDTLEKYKTWLSTHNTEVYYVLATPTYTEITDSTLITQLEAINYARSYEPQTNISQENNDKPFILDVTALKQLTQ